MLVFFFSSRRRHTRWTGDWSSDVCSSDLTPTATPGSVADGPGTSAVPILAGSTEIADVNRVLKLHLDDADFTTIGGLLFGRLGRLPKVGDRVNLQGATFEILEMDGRRVGRVRVWPATAHVPEPST